MDDPSASRRSLRSERRSHKRLLLTALGPAVVTVAGSGAVLWLTAHVLTGAQDDLPPVDGVELLKVGL